MFVDTWVAAWVLGLRFRLSSWEQSADGEGDLKLCVVADTLESAMAARGMLHYVQEDMKVCQATLVALKLRGAFAEPVCGASQQHCTSSLG